MPDVQRDVFEFQFEWLVQMYPVVARVCGVRVCVHARVQDAVIDSECSNVSCVFSISMCLVAKLCRIRCFQKCTVFGRKCAEVHCAHFTPTCKVGVRKFDVRIVQIESRSEYWRSMCGMRIFGVACAPVSVPCNFEIRSANFR